MNHTHKVTTSDRFIGNVFSRPSGRAELTDISIRITDDRSGKVSEFKKADIAVVKNSFFWVFQIISNNDQQKLLVVSTYTKQQYLLTTAISALLVIMLFVPSFLPSFNRTALVPAGVFIGITLSTLVIQYLPYRKLQNSLKKFGYL